MDINLKETTKKDIGSGVIEVKPYQPQFDLRLLPISYLTEVEYFDILDEMIQDEEISLDRNGEYENYVIINLGRKNTVCGIR